jgi:nucleoside-diphosphate-sugar epimerase
VIWLTCNSQFAKIRYEAPVAPHEEQPVPILILGGTNFIGPHVVRHLHQHGHDVTLFHRGQHETDLLPEVRHIHGDRARLEDHAAEFAGLEPDVVIDMRPMTEGEAETVVRTFAPIAGRLVAISSMDVYCAFGVLIGVEPEPLEPVPLTEDSPLRTRLYPYRSDPPRDPADPARWLDDYDKILVERVFMSRPDVPGTILRLPMVYGPGDYQHRFHDPVKRMMDRRPAIPLDELQARWRPPLGYVENVAQAIALAATDDRATGRVYNVAEADLPSYAERIRQIGEVAGWDGKVIALPSDRLPEPLRAEGNLRQDLCADSSRIRRELDYAEEIPRAETLRRTIAWETEHPPENLDPQQFDYATEDEILSSLSP